MSSIQAMKTGLTLTNNSVTLERREASEFRTCRELMRDVSTDGTQSVFRLETLTVSPAGWFHCSSRRKRFWGFVFARKRFVSIHFILAQVEKFFLPSVIDL
jgi:hypothetical protein